MTCLRLFFIFLFITVHSAYALDEYTVKSVFIHNFALGVSSKSPSFYTSSKETIFCTIGDDPFGSAIDYVSAQAPRGVSLIIRRHVNLKDAEHCHLLFISRSERYRTDQLIAKLTGKPIVTISEIEHFATRGGMIEFTYSGNDTIQFTLNHRAMRSAGFNVATFLLEAATKVIH